MSEHQWLWECDRVIPTDTNVGREVMEELLGQLESQQWLEHDIFSVRLAMEEALVNAICHGNQKDTSKNIHIACCLSPDVVRIQITDEGPGFAPDDLPDPREKVNADKEGGRGVMLMRHFMSRVEFNDSGNTVVMEKEQDKQ